MSSLYYKGDIVVHKSGKEFKITGVNWRIIPGTRYYEYTYELENSGHVMKDVKEGELKYVNKNNESVASLTQMNEKLTQMYEKLNDLILSNKK